MNKNPNNKEKEVNYVDSRTPEEKANEPTYTVTTSSTTQPVENKCCELCEGNHRLFKSKEARVDCKCHIPQSNTMENKWKGFCLEFGWELDSEPAQDVLKLLSQVRKETIREMKEKIDDYILNVINKSSFTYETLVAKQNTAKDVINLLSKDIEQ